MPKETKPPLNTVKGKLLSLLGCDAYVAAQIFEQADIIYDLIDIDLLIEKTKYIKALIAWDIENEKKHLL